MLHVQLTAVGHENVRATHASTLELTTDDWLTPAGDCILGVEATKAPAAFDANFVAACQDTEATITLELAVDGSTTMVVGRGDPALTFTNERSLVVRTSEYIDDRTVMVEADTAAGGIDRSIVESLQAGAALEATITVTS